MKKKIETGSRFFFDLEKFWLKRQGNLGFVIDILVEENGDKRYG